MSNIYFSHVFFTFLRCETFIAKQIQFQLTKCNNELHKKIDDLQRIIHVHQTTMNDAVDVEISAQAESIAGDENIENVRKEYEQKIRTMQFELSKAIGENMEFEDMKNTYMDEINCLKVNLVATEELYKESVAQSNILTSRNAYLSQELTDNKKHIGAMNSQIDFLKQQVCDSILRYFHISCDSYNLIHHGNICLSLFSWINTKRISRMNESVAKN